MTGLSSFFGLTTLTPSNLVMLPTVEVNPAAWSHLLCPVGEGRRGNPAVGCPAWSICGPSILCATAGRHLAWMDRSASVVQRSVRPLIAARGRRTHRNRKPRAGRMRGRWNQFRARWRIRVHAKIMNSANATVARIKQSSANQTPRRRTSDEYLNGVAGRRSPADGWRYYDASISIVLGGGDATRTIYDARIRHGSTGSQL